MAIDVDAFGQIETGASESRVSALETRMTTAETDISKLKGGSYVYGVDVDMSNSSPSAGHTKVVLNTAHDVAGDAARYTTVSSFTRMPCHNLRRCVMSSLANRTIAYYLNASDSTKKADGTAADLTGTDGDVMVEFPVSYYRIDKYTDSTTQHEHVVKLISDAPFSGAAPYPAFYVSSGGATVRTQYMGAFKASVDGTKLRSVAGVKYIVGGVSGARTCAANNGGSLVHFLLKCWLGWLLEIEFGSTDSQTVVSPGFTNINTYSPSINVARYNGRTASLGNGSGSILADDSDSSGADYDLKDLWVSGASKVVACSYRGVENPWGAIQETEDGIQIRGDGTEGDYTNSGYWFTTDTSSTVRAQLDTDKGTGPAGSAFPAAGNTGASVVWVSQAWPKVSAFYAAAYDPLTFFPNAAGGNTGSTSTYLCDAISSNNYTTARALIRGLGFAWETKAGMYALLCNYRVTINFSTRLAC